MSYGISARWGGHVGRHALRSFVSGGQVLEARLTFGQPESEMSPTGTCGFRQLK